MDETYTAEEHAAVWRAFEANEITHSAAHYLLAIADNGHDDGAPRAVDVARQLGVSRAAASSQLRTLKEHGLVRQDSRHRLHLTPIGAEIVARVVSKREVIRTFLTEVLGVREATASLDACKIEHLLSEESGAALLRLVRFLRADTPAARACMELVRLADFDCCGGGCGLCAGTGLAEAAGPDAGSDDE